MKTDREFATEVTQKLQAAGFTALFAGGCVRDALLNMTPKDYDVATDAMPEQVRELFGFKRTLPIGAAFGVITVLGPRSANPIEVATFRRDGGYSDGRRPDSVEFTDAREDALRRDFTINGMFFDPITEKVIDYVDGQTDLGLRQIRAIGNAEERIDEDKLRMLRGIRFAATYDFSIEEKTLTAIQKRASEIGAVSSERIGGEIIRIFSHLNFARGFELLVESSLWYEILPAELAGQPDTVSKRLNELKRLKVSENNPNQAATVMVVLLRQSIENHHGSPQKVKQLLSELQNAWKLSNELIKSFGWIVDALPILMAADQRKWSEVQPWLVPADAVAALDVIAAVGDDRQLGAVAFARAKLELPKNELDPDPFVSGQDLIEIGISPGPQFKTVLQSIRDGQLDGEISSREEALVRLSQMRND